MEEKNKIEGKDVETNNNKSFGKQGNILFSNVVEEFEFIVCNYNGNENIITI